MQLKKAVLHMIEMPLKKAFLHPSGNGQKAQGDHR